MDKTLIRKGALERRKAYVSSITQGSRERIAMALVDRVHKYFNFPKDFIIASYVAREDELDVRLLNFFLQEEGHIMAYPRVNPNGNLCFHKISHARELIDGSFGLKEPPETAPPVDPDLFFVPLVAFDQRCHRLGYGKGHYDRALNQARSQRNVLAIGVAYDMQRIDEIPNEPLDQQLDFVVTEAQIYRANTR